MYQRTLVIGHVGRDPEMRYLPNGTPVASFSVATTRKWKNANGEQQEKTTWFKVTTWRKLAETCNQYVTKGLLVLVEGEMDASSWMGQDGKPRATLELTALNVRFLGSRGAREGGPSTTSEEPPEGLPGSEEEIPF
jgi:single-strand DNA-binding protein